MTAHPATAAPDDLEVWLLQEAMLHRWGLDFRRWAPASFRRRVQTFARDRGLGTAADLLPLMIREPLWRDALVTAVSRHDTALFRDPGTWLALRHKALPVLRTWPRMRWWLPACSGGEELWTLLVLLQEEGLLERSRIYATDLSEELLAEARAGWRSGEVPTGWIANHRDAGGTGPLDRWFAPDGEGVRLEPALLNHVVFARHDLTSEASHNLFHGIICRNALLYLDSGQVERVQETLWRSLVPFGFLQLGRREALGPGTAARFEAVDVEERLFRRVR